VIKTIKKFWLESYKSDKTAFYFEIISFIFTVGASLSLAITADSPDMTIVYPGFFIGAITAIYAFYRRKLAWPMLLTTYFAFVNVFGFGVAIGWW
jgi:hypothetical protein